MSKYDKLYYLENKAKFKKKYLKNRKFILDTLTEKRIRKTIDKSKIVYDEEFQCYRCHKVIGERSSINKQRVIKSWYSVCRICINGLDKGAHNVAIAAPAGDPELRKPKAERSYNVACRKECDCSECHVKKINEEESP